MISVVIPVRNDPDHLRASLERLQASLYSDYEVVVVDDASTDDGATGAVARAAGARVLRLERNRGPAAARNLGAREARGDHLFFIDADVCVHPDTLGLVAQAFAEDASVDALFGSYDRTPGAPSLLAQYKNLFHHFVHQQGAEEASTFWTGCGAIKRSVFLELGGFDEGYGRPCIEDIELGVRLRRAGRRIRLRKEIQVTHLKRWTLWSILKSDVLDRGIPWTQLILRERNLPNDLNLSLAQRSAAGLAYLLAASVLVAAWWRPALLLVPLVALLSILLLDYGSARGRADWPSMLLAAAAGAAAVAVTVVTLRWWALLPAALLLAIVAINWRFYLFFARVRHPAFALVVVPLHVLYYLYSGFALALGTASFLLGSRSRGASKPTPRVETR